MSELERQIRLAEAGDLEAIAALLERVERLGAVRLVGLCWRMWRALSGCDGRAAGLRARCLSLLVAHGGLRVEHVHLASPARCTAAVDAEALRFAVFDALDPVIGSAVCDTARAVMLGRALRARQGGQPPQSFVAQDAQWSSWRVHEGALYESNDGGLTWFRVALAELDEALPDDPSLCTVRLLEQVNAVLQHVEHGGHAPSSTPAVACAALTLAGGRADVAHVGHCRVYRLRGERLEALTCDHTLERELEIHGVIAQPASQVPLAAHGDALVRALGTERRVSIEQRVAALQPDDLFLLCTTHLPEALPHGQIERLLASGQAAGEALEVLARQLGVEVLGRGRQPRVALVLVRVVAAS